MAKTIVISRGKSQSFPQQNPRHNPTDPFRYGDWCKVIERHSEDHTVDVITADGLSLTRIPVASREWVTADDPVLGERNLPPEGSIVFMLMPTGGVDNAFIFGSCFLPLFDKHMEEFLKEGKEDEELTRLEGNWQRVFDKKTGDLEITGTDDNDNTLTIIVKKSEGRIEIKDWNDNDITFEKDGIKIRSKEGAMEYKAESSKLIDIGNAIDTLGNMGSSLMQTIISMKLVGQPSQHVVSPDDIVKFTQQKETWEKVFKK